MLVNIKNNINVIAIKLRKKQTLATINIMKSSIFIMLFKFGLLLKCLFVAHFKFGMLYGRVFLAGKLHSVYGIKFYAKSEKGGGEL